MNQSTTRDDSFERLLNQFAPLDRPWLTVNRSRQATRTGAVRPRRKSSAQGAAALNACMPVSRLIIARADCVLERTVQSRPDSRGNSALSGRFEDFICRSRSENELSLQWRSIMLMCNQSWQTKILAFVWWNWPWLAMIMKDSVGLMNISNPSGSVRAWWMVILVDN